MLAAFRNAIYSPKLDKSAPARHGIRLHDRLQSLTAPSFRKGQRDDRPPI